MHISLDYDETITRDPEFWLDVVASARKRGHKVYIVTMRYDNQHEAAPVRKLAKFVDGILFTGRKAKVGAAADAGIRIDVWIDDKPFFILEDARG